MVWDMELIKRIIKRWKIKVDWFTHCNNSIGYKILVLLGIMKSPTLGLILPDLFEKKSH